MSTYGGTPPPQYLGPPTPSHDGFVIAMLTLQALATIAAIIALAIKVWNFWSRKTRKKQMKNETPLLGSRTELSTNKTLQDDVDKMRNPSDPQLNSGIMLERLPKPSSIVEVYDTIPELGLSEGGPRETQYEPHYKMDA